MDEQVKIWQRVRPEATPVTDGLPGLAANAISQANLYGSLARQAQGSRRNLLLKLCICIVLFVTPRLPHFFVFNSSL